MSPQSSQSHQGNKGHQELTEFKRLYEVVEKLLDPKEGCPWDLKQTHHTLLEFLIEESYEFVHATEENNYPHMEEEIGDVLMQVLMHAEMAKKSGHFDFTSVCKTLADKLIYRHPHIFAEESKNVKTAEEVLENWEKLKPDAGDGKIKPALLSFPALFSAYKIGKKSKKLDFDWDHYSQVMYKVEEEWQEVKEELPPSGEFNRARVTEEIGDMLFSLAQLARHLEINPEEALRQANKKFIRRFNKIPISLKGLSEEAKEKEWAKVKNDEE